MTTIQKTLNVAVQDFCIEVKQATKQTRFNAYNSQGEVKFPVTYEIDEKGCIKPETLKIEGLEIPQGFRMLYMNTTNIQNCYPECYNKFTHNRLSHIVIKQSFDAFFVYLVHKESYVFDNRVVKEGDLDDDVTKHILGFAGGRGF